MSETHFVVQGALCKCNLSQEKITDKLKVKTQSKHFANDKDGTKKLIATSKELGKTLEKDSFGNCMRKPLGNNVYGVCIPDFTQWSGCSKKVTLSNGGKLLLESSKATCSFGTPDCIEIVNHGQIAELTKEHFKKANPDVQNKINPLLGLNNMMKPKLDYNGIEQK